MIDAVIDRHKNKTAICIGHGPSLDTYHHKLKSFKDDGVIGSTIMIYHRTIGRYAGH
jgi:hypothetical protein